MAAGSTAGALAPRSPSRTHRVPGPQLRALAVLLGAAAFSGALGSAHAADLPAVGMAATRAEDLRAVASIGTDRALVLAPAGLYRLRLESETWTLTTEREGLPAAPLTGLCPTAEELWITGADGASVSDMRFDDWRRYGPAQGLPGRLVADIESDEDYAYAATDSGAARFDRYVLEWEALPGPDGRPLGPCTDVALEGERVWFALAYGLGEFRPGPESMRVLRELGGFSSPMILALRQTPRHLWAITPVGLARYDKRLETWTSYAAGAEVPDARIYQAELQGDDLWLATDAGLWRYIAQSGIWRRHESADQMPGTRVTAFALEPQRIWVVTERAFAVYEEEDARWIDFTPSVPLAPARCRRLILASGGMILLGEDRIVYGLSQGETNPSLFSYREIPIEVVAAGAGAARRWSLGLDSGGLGITAPSGESATIKGGATIYIEEEQEKEEGLGDLAAETRVDASVNGRLRGDRTVSGFYDNTDPDNVAYQLEYRGAHDDLVRSVSAGEIDQQLFNTQLVPETGLRGAHVRAEVGARSEATRRRRLTADGWAGERRTFPGRDVFRGGSRAISGSLRDRDYARRVVFALPDSWRSLDPDRLQLYRDDGVAATDDANTLHAELAGRAGSWDRLVPHEAYVPGPDRATLILVAPLGAQEQLVAVAGGAAMPAEVDLSGADVRNAYWLAGEPEPGSLAVSIADSSGATLGGDGRSYLARFGLDANGDGALDAERFSPLTGLLTFPDSLPFPPEVYAEGGPSLYRIAFTYRTAQTVFQTSHPNLVPGSERIAVDREQLQSNTDYTLIPSTGIFVLFEHVLLDDDSVIEVSYMYESTGAGEEPPIATAQLGLAPNDHLFVGTSALRWEDEGGRATTNAGVNARLEWKDTRSFVRCTPEIAFSHRATDGDGGAADRDGAQAIELQTRHGGVEVSGSYRALGADFTTMEDRRTLLGRLREESRVNARWDPNRRLQAELEWSSARSDSVARGAVTGQSAVASADTFYTSGEERALLARLALLNSGLPNLALTRGLVSQESPEGRMEKWITRAELELDPAAERLRPLRLQRLWVRSFFQRSDRRQPVAAGSERERRVTDHAYLRLNGSCGNPFAWNLILEDRETQRPPGATAGEQDLRRYQRIDGTAQLRPHPSVDAYARWESDRALYWHASGETQGYETGRLAQTNVQLYPGRICGPFTPLSLRFDFSDGRDHRGEPGDEQPDAASLFESIAAAPERAWTRSRVLESRLQLTGWLRLVTRLEDDRQDDHREELRATVASHRVENRLEARPRGGLINLRVTTQTAESGLVRSQELARFLGDWDQTWGRGLLTYSSLELSRTDDEEGRAAGRTDLISPRARVTLRREFLHFDGSLGVAYTLTRTEDRSAPPTGESSDGRSLALTASCTIQPLPVLSLKAQYGLTRSQPEGSGSRDWTTAHDLKLRIAVRV